MNNLRAMLYGISLDACAAKKDKEEKAKKKGMALDSANAAAGEYALKDLAAKGVAAVQQWVETNDLDSGETNADRLMALIVGVADADKNGEITDDESVVLEVALNSAFDYLVSKGISEEDADKLLNDWDADTADRVRDAIAAALPEGDEAAESDIDDFVFGESDQEPAYDAVYKNVTAVRHGKKVRIHKRIAGKVRLSPKQKVAIRKMQMKSHNSRSMARRLRSNLVRHKFGMK